MPDVFMSDADLATAIGNLTDTEVFGLLEDSPLAVRKAAYRVAHQRAESEALGVMRHG